MPLIIIRSNRVLEEGKKAKERVREREKNEESRRRASGRERKRARGRGEKKKGREEEDVEGREERRISSLRFDRVGVDRRLIDSPPRHGNFFEEPAGLPFFCNTYHLTELLPPRLRPSPNVLPPPPLAPVLCLLRSSISVPSPRRVSERRFDDPTMTYSLCRLAVPDAGHFAISHSLARSRA